LPAKPGAGPQLAQAAPFWMSLTLPPELAGELPMVAAGHIPSGPLSKRKGQTAQPQVPPAMPAPAPPPVAPVAQAPQAAPTPQPVSPPVAQPGPGPLPTVKIGEVQIGEFQLIMPGGRKISLAADKEYTLGRAHSGSPAEIDLSEYGGDTSQGVSRKHARLVVAHSRCFLEDLGSKNGTSVNDRRLGPGERCPLSGGEKVTLGSFILHVSKG